MSDITEVLAEHVMDGTVFQNGGTFYIRCKCGARVERAGEPFRAHVAAVLEPLIRARIRKEVRRIAGELPFAAYVSWGPIEYATWVEQQAPEIEGADQ